VSYAGPVLRPVQVYGVAVDQASTLPHGQHGEHQQHEVFQNLPFPFTDSRFPHDLGAVVQRTVLDGREPARVVVHDDENSWLVGDGKNDPNSDGACVVSCIHRVIEKNSTVAGLADLPLGHIAHRKNPGKPWVVEPHSYPDE
jgi:hypothetical protein